MKFDKVPQGHVGTSSNAAFRYFIKRLKGQCFPPEELRLVFCALVISRILGALPAWGDFLTSDLVILQQEVKVI